MSCQTEYLTRLIHRMASLMIVSHILTVQPATHNKRCYIMGPGCCQSDTFNVNVRFKQCWFTVSLRFCVALCITCTKRVFSFFFFPTMHLFVPIISCPCIRDQTIMKHELIHTDFLLAEMEIN